MSDILVIISLFFLAISLITMTGFYIECRKLDKLLEMLGNNLEELKRAAKKPTKLYNEGDCYD